MNVSIWEIIIGRASKLGVNTPMYCTVSKHVLKLATPPANVKSTLPDWFKTLKPLWILFYIYASRVRIFAQLIAQ